jgi:hypothetical protein
MNKKPELVEYAKSITAIIWKQAETKAMNRSNRWLRGKK